jgi:hypothetical protein
VCAVPGDFMFYLAARVILRGRHAAEYRCRIINRCIQIDIACLFRLENSREDAIDNERMPCSAQTSVPVIGVGVVADAGGFVQVMTFPCIAFHHISLIHLLSGHNERMLHQEARLQVRKSLCRTTLTQRSVLPVIPLSRGTPICLPQLCKTPSTRNRHIAPLA